MLGSMVLQATKYGFHAWGGSGGPTHEGINNLIMAAHHNVTFKIN
jgi:hypothetical protein